METTTTAATATTTTTNAAITPSVMKPWENIQCLTQQNKKKFSNSAKSLTIQRIRNMPTYQHVDGKLFDLAFLMTENGTFSFEVACSLISKATILHPRLVEKHAICVLSSTLATQSNHDGSWFTLHAGKVTICKTNIKAITQRGFHQIICTAMPAAAAAVAIGADDADATTRWNQLVDQYNAVYRELFQVYQEVVNTFSPKAEELAKNKRNLTHLRGDRVDFLKIVGIEPTASFGGHGGFSASMDQRNLRALFPGYASATQAVVEVTGEKPRGSITSNLGIVGMASNILLNTHENIIHQNYAKKVAAGEMSPEEGRKRAKIDIDEKLSVLRPLVHFHEDRVENAELMMRI